jgi:uncharacterized small protein (DUF1192 family)
MKRYNSDAEEDRLGNFVLYDDAQAELAQLRANLSLAEEGLANYQQEVERLKAERDQWKKRADELFFAEPK